MNVPPLKVIFEEKDREFILKEIDAVLSSGMLSAGKNVKTFEEFWANYTQIGLKRDDELILTRRKVINPVYREEDLLPAL